MDNETNLNGSESEVVEPSKEINENGCDEQTDETDAVTESEDKTELEQEEILSENKTEEECLSPKESSPSTGLPNEIDQFAVIDSEPSECSPEKVACIVSSPSETERDELGNDKSWSQLENESSPEKSQSDVACVISSPSEAEMDETANDKSWGQLNESVSEGSIDDGPESEDEKMENDYPSVYGVAPLVYQEMLKNRKKPAPECPVFELTDDNSSVDDVRSEVDDDMDGDEMGEEEEDSGKSIKSTLYMVIPPNPNSAMQTY